MPTQNGSGGAKLFYPETRPPATPIGMTRTSATIGRDFLGQNYIILLWDFSRIVADSCSVMMKYPPLPSGLGAGYFLSLSTIDFRRNQNEWRKKMDDILRKEARLLKAL